MSKIGLGVVGVGTMGKHHAENVRYRIPEAQLVAVADAPAGSVPNLRLRTTTTALQGFWSERTFRPWSLRPPPSSTPAIFKRVPGPVRIFCVRSPWH